MPEIESAQVAGRREARSKNLILVSQLGRFFFRRWEVFNNRGGVFNLKYPLVWCPKYRVKLLRGLYAQTLRALLCRKAQQMQVNIEALVIMPDHIHLFVSVRPTDCPAKLANLFKGYTSFMMRRRSPGLAKRFKSLWSPSYYIGSVGHVSEETVKRYIAAQIT